MPQPLDCLYQRSASVRLRRTACGGAAFWPEQAATVDLEEGAFALLCGWAVPQTARQMRGYFTRRFGRNVTLAEVDRLARRLEEYGFLIQVQPGTVHRETAAAEGAYCEPETVPVAPESVHLQLNNVCNLRCPFCYVGQEDQDGGSLPLERWMTLVDEMAEMGVFQVAFGGGEPLLSPYLIPLVQHVRRRGLLPHVTTNGHLLTEEVLAPIRDVIGEVRLSLNEGTSVDRGLLVQKAHLLQAQAVRFGFNLIVTRRNVRQLEVTLREWVALRPSSITLIRPKPAPHNQTWYAAHALSAQDSRVLLAQLRRLEPLFTDTLLTVDCAFSYLFRDLPEAEIIRRGVAGCAMAERFMVVAWNGDVYPCSHLRAGEFRVGNVTEQSLTRIWETNPLWAYLRGEMEQVDGPCGRCARRRFCGGCRAIMWHTARNLRAADTGCPAS